MQKSRMQAAQGIKEEIVPSFYNFHPISAYFFNSACAREEERLGLLLAAFPILFNRVFAVHVGKSAEAEFLI
jgi:hypothetical protein